MKKFKRKGQSPQTPKWWLGGTLHQAPISVWHKKETTWGDAIATCCDYIHAAKELNNWAVAPFKTQDEVLEMCTALATALIRGTKEHLATVGHQRMADIVPVAMAMLGWLKQNEISEDHKWLKEALSEQV